MAGPVRVKGYWISDLTAAQRQVLDVMRRHASEAGLLSKEVAQHAGLKRADYATARLQALAKRGLVYRHDKDDERWLPVTSALAKMEPLPSQNVSKGGR